MRCNKGRNYSPESACREMLFCQPHAVFLSGCRNWITATESICLFHSSSIHAFIIQSSYEEIMTIWIKRIRSGETCEEIGSSPLVSVYSDRIESVSIGVLLPGIPTARCHAGAFTPDPLPFLLPSVKPDRAWMHAAEIISDLSLIPASVRSSSLKGCVFLPCSGESV